MSNWQHDIRKRLHHTTDDDNIGTGSSFAPSALDEQQAQRIVEECYDAVLTPTQGQILFDGTDIRTLGGSYRAHLGYLPQDFGYYPNFTALDYMMYLAALKGLLDRKQTRVRCLQLLLGAAPW
ncbi:hypothetical protein [Adlercreutzia sp. ZJ141]|uniref:hypothetical protein n=1 Tax=Adlercreutzia sp. ZJ141 TaxID=2709406 RepID=UPI001F15177C|nr:hypothetical protein [Adlercreutzia sp. ZJ141]